MDDCSRLQLLQKGSIQLQPWGAICLSSGRGPTHVLEIRVYAKLIVGGSGVKQEVVGKRAQVEALSFTPGA